MKEISKGRTKAKSMEDRRLAKENMKIMAT